MKRRSPTRFVLAGSALLLATAWSATPLQGAIDPHYDGLLRQGSYALERGDAATASKLLRLACFGMLDDSAALTDCLLRLGIAQGRSDDAEGVAETFRRVGEVESRDHTYTAGSLPAALRDSFEETVARLVPRSALSESPTFRHLASRSEEIEIRRLPPSRRRDEIARHIAAEPTQGRWKLLAAETAIEEGRWDEATDWAGKALAEVRSAHEMSDGHCLRGYALARLDRCADAVTDLASCADSRTTVEPARALLGCWLDLGRMSEAAEFLAELSPSLREDRQIQSLARRLPVAPGGGATARREPEAAPPPPAPVPEPTTTAPAASTPAPASAELTAAESGKLEQARRLLAEARRRADLEEPLRLAREVADAQPNHADSQFLAASIAYRSSRWAEAVHYFRRGGEPDSAELLFYFAVSLYETGDRETAAAVLRRSLSGLERTPFVESYRQKILPGSAGPGGT